MNITLEPSWWTPVTWPRYSLKYKLFAIPFLVICALLVLGFYAKGTHPLVGGSAIAVAIVLYLVIGGITLSLELYQNSTG